MSNTDINYLCTVIANLSGIPVRVYTNGEQTFYSSIVRLPKDPVCTCQRRISEVTEHVGYVSTDHYHYYGIVNSGHTKIVIGPSGQTGASDKELHELAFRTDVSPDEIPAFVFGMKAISRLPLESILQILCALNYVLNGERKTLEDVAIYDKEQEALVRESSEIRTARLTEDRGDGTGPHNTYDLEQRLTALIRKGDTAALRDWLSSAPAVRSGVIAPDQLRQTKNLFIVTATIASRAAIRGGMAQEDAFSLSDSYIQKCELLTDPARITNLQYHMIVEFTERVERLHLGQKPTKLTVDVANYVQRHLSEPISAEAIAKELYMSRPYLSRRFKEDSGQTVKDFILKEKTEEAKRLLRYSDKPLLAISVYLGFSSQSHFCRVFRRYTGINPGEYRE